MIKAEVSRLEELLKVLEVTSNGRINVLEKKVMDIALQSSHDAGVLAAQKTQVESEFDL